MDNDGTLKKYIRTIPDWPKTGIQFRDITTLIKDPEGFALATAALYRRYRDSGADAVAGIEARGFIFGAILAFQLGVGFIPVRKKGKLPGETVSKTYQLEYGEDAVEVHKDAVSEGMKIIVIDDLIATGGTALAACSLLTSLKAEIIEAAFVIDLPDLEGKARLKKAGVPVFSLVEFSGE